MSMTKTAVSHNWSVSPTRLLLRRLTRTREPLAENSPPLKSAGTGFGQEKIEGGRGSFGGHALSAWARDSFRGSFEKAIKYLLFAEVRFSDRNPEPVWFFMYGTTVFIPVCGRSLPVGRDAEDDCRYFSLLVSTDGGEQRYDGGRDRMRGAFAVFRRDWSALAVMIMDRYIFNLTKYFTCILHIA